MTRQDPIALVSTYYPPVRGGVETSAAGIARFLVERGHEVHVFTKRTTTEVPAEETMDGVAVHRLPPVGPRRGSGKWLVLRALTSALTRMKPAPRAIHCVDYRGVGLAALAASVYIVYLLEIVKLANPRIRRREQAERERKTA